jgi:ribosomal protein L11 methylase PrmA
MASAQISVYPLRQDRLRPAIVRVRTSLAGHGLTPEVGPMSTLLRPAGKVRGRSVLDVGGGDGGLTSAFPQNGAAHVIGCDIDPQTIARAGAQMKRDQAAINYIIANLRKPCHDLDQVLGASHMANAADVVSKPRQFPLFRKRLARPNRRA